MNLANGKVGRTFSIISILFQFNGKGIVVKKSRILSSSNQQQKQMIRKQVRAKRQALSCADKSQAEHQLLKQLFDSPFYYHAQKVACFLSFDGEISTHAVVEDILQSGKSCYLPKLKPFKPNRLWFMPYFKDQPMIENRYRIPESMQLPNHGIAVSALDLVLLPLVAFDNKGGRLGMGGGFYDATFAHLSNLKQRPKMVGLAYQCQLVDKLPVERWDLPLDGVITEQSVYQFTKT